MPLTDTAIRNLKPRDKPYKATDMLGLYLLVQPNGAKLWRMNYRYAQKQKTLAFGVYPSSSLADARAARDTARAKLSKGIDPAVDKRLTKITAAAAGELTFQLMAEEFVERRKKDGASARTIKKLDWLLRQVYPAIGKRPVTEIKPAEVYAILKKIESKEHLETAQRVRATCSRVFRFAIQTARAELDPCVSLVGATRTPKVKHHAAIFDPVEIGGLLRAIDGYRGLAATKNALKLTALTFMRSEELRYAVWSEFDLDDMRRWNIPAERMKKKRPHIVPLSTQAVALLSGMKADSECEFLFPSARTNNRPLSENAINAALRYMGYAKDEMTGHGFRRIASTVLNEHKSEQGFDRDWIERQLAHVEENRIRGAYNAAEYLPGRTVMMQWWADWLDRLRLEGVRE